jgi:ribosomal protein L11
MPVVGKSPTTTPALIKAHINMERLIPKAKKKPKSSGDRKAMDNPLKVKIKNKIMMPAQVKNPPSSPMVAKTKSV